ncbi:hypothetical protein [Rhizobium alvei]|uniref:Uncharacterized protein n=1 Tax=Rhizobium alvei TaxID=1132659 RepID=A0ABT8YTY8_9HYPH|nr:hypothetical protein [Rhizobium alvei]MDO6966980.1 hypothetical protein [Rhizobium alvei]
MAFDYAKSRATAERLIGRFGQAGAIKRTTDSGPAYGPAYDPTVTTTNYACTLVVIDIALDKIDGTLIEATDKMAYVSTSGLAIDITTADFIEVGGVEHAIKIVRPLNPAGTVVLWEVVFTV